MLTCNKMVKLRRLMMLSRAGMSLTSSIGESTWLDSNGPQLWVESIDWVFVFKYLNRGAGKKMIAESHAEAMMKVKQTYMFMMVPVCKLLLAGMGYFFMY